MIANALSNSDYLLPVDDRLPNRPSKQHSKRKLELIEAYLAVAMKAVSNKGWAATCYIDLQAGPGKNYFDDINEVRLGSPLIALNNPHPFTMYRFNEWDPKLADALLERCAQSPLRNRIKVYRQDLNIAVEEVCRELEEINRRSYATTFNIALLDPEGLELHWDTVARLARLPKMDLIINFSTSGLTRGIPAGTITELANKFFGTTTWHSIYKPAGDATYNRRALIDFYMGRLKELGYVVDLSDPEDVAVKNSKNAQVYSMLFASKHELGDHFWRQVVKYSQGTRRLPGF